MMITTMIAAIWAACFPGCRKSKVSLLDTCIVVVKLVTCEKSSTAVARTLSLKVSWQGAGVASFRPLLGQAPTYGQNQQLPLFTRVMAVALRRNQMYRTADCACSCNNTLCARGSSRSKKENALCGEYIRWSSILYQQLNHFWNSSKIQRVCVSSHKKLWKKSEFVKFASVTVLLHLWA